MGTSRYQQYASAAKLSPKRLRLVGRFRVWLLALQFPPLVLRSLPPDLTQEAAMMGVAVEQMLDRADARPLVDGVASGQSSPQSPVSSSQRRRLGRRLPRWVARPRATQDRLDAGRSRGGSGAVPPTGGARPQP